MTGACDATLAAPAEKVHALDYRGDGYDPALFGSWFQGPSWQPWRSFLRVAFGLPLSDQDLALFKQCTGRTMPPAEAISEWWCLAGRRGGKSLISALCGAYLALFHDYRQFLAPGERATVMLLASDVKQAPLVNLFNFCRDSFLGISFIESKKAAPSAVR